MSPDSFTASQLKHEHRPVKLVALKKIPKQTVAGEEIGPYVENAEFEVKLWVADELVRLSLAQLLPEKEPLDLTELQKTQMKETMQTSRRLSKLPEDFYPRFKRLLKALEEESRTEHAKMAELQKAIQLSTDILTCRLNKILILTSVTEKSDAVLQNLTPEERTLYEALYGEVEKWRTASWPQKEDK